MTIRPARYGGALLGVALAHWLGATLSLHFATVANTTPVWLPAGIDLALLTLLGVRAWPGVFLGDFVATTIGGVASVPVMVAMSCGNTLAMVLAAGAVRRWTGAPASLRTRADVLVVTLVAAPLAAVLSGAIGITALSLGGLPEAARGSVLRGWVLGDVAGAVVVAPALLALGALRLRIPSGRRAVEAAMMLTALIAVSAFAVRENHDEAYLVFPVLVWAALRFGVRGAAVTSALAAVLVVLGHVHDAGDGVTELLEIQSFMAVCSLTGLLLAATSGERAAAVRSERALRSQLQAYFTHAPVALFMKDLTGRYLALNKTVAGLHGSTVDALIGRHLDDAFSPGDRDHLRAADLAVAATGEPLTVFEEIATVEGLRTFESTKFPLLDEDGAIYGVGGIAVDVTERLLAEREREAAHRALAHRAMHDPLTGLANRAHFDDRLAAALERTRGEDSALALVLIDLDQFKTVNDSLGHQAGDELLRRLAPRLEAAARPGDLVARLGGDEFVVLSEGLAGPWEAVAAAQRLSAAWADPLPVGDEDVFVSGAAGVAVSRGKETTAATLLREADAAMYRAKERGRGQVELYDDAMRARAYDRLRLESDLRRAYDAGDIQVAYQPIVDLRDGRPVAVEALARWRHPDRGWVSPASFIPIAEDSGMIAALGADVLRQACARLARWRAELPGANDLQVSVNVSVRQILHGELLGQVRDTLRETGLPPDALALEVTESVLMEESEAPAAVLAALRALGVIILLDDFGTGYSSLGYLRHFALDGIKLDRSFVDGVAAPDAAAVVEAIVSMATTLGLSVTAEGIETAQQAERLREIGCPRGQGYVLARPLLSGEIENVLVRQLRTRAVVSAPTRPASRTT